MLLLLIGALVVALILWRGWGKPVLTRGQWRMGAGLLSIGTIVGGAFVALRGAWEEGLGLVFLGGVLAFAARTQRGARPAASPSKASGMSLADARSVLGVGVDASVEDIRAAYARLMRMAHPDSGGTTGLAAQLNAARDRLLKS